MLGWTSVVISSHSNQDDAAADYYLDQMLHPNSETAPFLARMWYRSSIFLGPSDLNVYHPINRAFVCPSSLEQ